MSKRQESESYSKATITFEDDGEIMITEYNKEDVVQYSLTKVLEEWENIDGVSLTIKKEAQRPSNIE
ncbi:MULTISPECIES: YonK family protein [unclassified Clostridium]|uniref:YonK family protein n=1 Tax=unclassified Clostridium TaxID=2614128 RepID=UPI0013EE55FF|nr:MULTISPECIES: YonK family protein [unclassified Clostridium]MBZ9693411.1 YonK family protein [Clostridium sp. M14]